MNLINPRREWYDIIPARIRSWFKQGKNHHNVIYDNYLILGAAPLWRNLRKLKKISPAGVIRVSLLSSKEEKSMKFRDDNAIEVHHIALLDHGVIDESTGLNIVYEKFRQAMISIKRHSGDKILYFHCMAGRSRSLMAVIAYLYINNIPTRRMPLDIAEYIKIKRKKVRSLGDKDSIDGDQAGFIGLMALIEEEQKIRTNRSLLINDRYCRMCAQNISLVLKYPLNSGFRDKGDLNKQFEAFRSLFLMFKSADRDLLSEMLFPYDFAKLPPSSQARLAVILQDLSKQGILLPAEYDSLDCARIAVKKIKKIPAGDLMVLHNIFGDKLPEINIVDLKKRMQKRITRVDGYNSAQ